MWVIYDILTLHPTWKVLVGSLGKTRPFLSSALFIHSLPVLKCRVCHIPNLEVPWDFWAFSSATRCVFPTFRPLHHPVVFLSVLPLLSHLPRMFRMNLSGSLSLSSPQTFPLGSSVELISSPDNFSFTDLTFMPTSEHVCSERGQQSMSLEFQPCWSTQPLPPLRP